MNRYVKWIGITVLVGVVALAGASVALAQGGNPPATAVPFGPGWGGMMGGYGYGFMTEYRDLMHTPIAEALGLSLDEFYQQLGAGKTPWQMAQEKNVDAATLQAAMQEGMAVATAQAVKDGKLTQAQADYMLAHSAQMVGWRAAGGYGSMMGRGFRGTNGAGASLGPCHGNWATPTPAPAS